jgi:hypothetical protein
MDFKLCQRFNARCAATARALVAAAWSLLAKQVSIRTIGGSISVEVVEEGGGGGVK